MTTFFDGEIISRKYPFLTRKWDADEDVDKKHWVRYYFSCQIIFYVCVFCKLNIMFVIIFSKKCICCIYFGIICWKVFLARNLYA